MKKHKVRSASVHPADSEHDTSTEVKKTGNIAGSEDRLTGAPGDAPAQCAADEQHPAADSTAFPIVGIGASAGGLDAFTRLLRPMPLDTGMAFVLVQHLEANRESQLTEILARVTKLPVTEVTDGVEVAPNHVYIIPPNTCMALSAGRLHLSPRTIEPGLNLPIDHFLRSLAAAQKSRAIGVVLSGMASDGTLGLEAIKGEGGITFAQDEASAKYDSMPESAMASGFVDFVLPPEELAGELVRLARHPYVRLPEAEKTDVELPGEPDDLSTIFTMLHGGTGDDFTYYRHATIKRRILRRMALHKHERLDQYVRFLKDTPGEVQLLYQDILIHVTGFFRDTEVFQALQDRVFPELLQGRGPDTPFRIWVPGCATGEEAYSIAICLLEFLEAQAKRCPIQIFATDITMAEIAKARAGWYPETIKLDVTPERLQRYFVEAPGGYRLRKAVRESCVFAQQNMLRDPPFARLDLVSCRNVLIYLGQMLKERAMETFHYALNPSGFLMLGSAETVGVSSDLFAAVDKHNRIYKRKATQTRLHFDFARGGHAPPQAGKRASAEPVVQFDLQREADRRVLARYGPAGVVVNEALEILQFRGQTGPYLAHAAGGASFNIVTMAREGLRSPLQVALLQAKRDHAGIRKEHIRFTADGQPREVNLNVELVQDPGTQEFYYLILFEDVPPPDAQAPREASGQAEQAIQAEQELTMAREHLQVLSDAQQTSNEELQAANEEVLSHNEELQSVNEELETAKEELQATNEELSTVNDELNARNLELGELNNDLTNLLRSIHIPIVMVDTELRIRRFTPMAEQVLNVRAGDVGRPFSDIRPNIDIPQLPRILQQTIATGEITERDVQDQDGHWYSLRVLPYTTTEQQTDGAVIALLDIHDIKQSHQLIEHARNYAQAIVETVWVPLAVLDAELRVVTANQAFYKAFQVTQAETEQRFLYELGDGQWNIPQLRTLLAEILPGRTEFHGFEVERDFPQIGHRSLLLNARHVEPGGAQASLILLVMVDVTEGKRSEEERRQLESKLNQAQRTESLGVLAGGIAHDFNNLLMGVLGHASLALMRLPPEAPARYNVEQIEIAAQRAAELTNQMLAYSGKGRYVIEAIDLTRLVEEMAHLLEASISKKVLLEYHFAADLPAIEGDASQIRQVVMNLITNASDSSGAETGVITLTTGTVQAEQANMIRSLTGNDLPPGTYVYLKVADTGSGMDAGTQAKMFDPFFSTKFTGRGLGLAAVLGIMRGHHGAIHMSSEPGQGTIIEILFPAARQPAALIAAPPAPGLEDWHGTGTILVVDDEEDVRSVTTLMLAEFGFHVLSAADGQQGVELYRAHADEIAVVLLDMTMPEMNGEEAFRAIRQIRPEARVILTSGYNEAETSRQFGGMGLAGFMHKPYQPQQLKAKLHEVLNP